MPTAVVVFDGYSETEVGTKDMERVRRLGKQPAPAVEINFNESMVPTVSQGNFLSNSKNKARLIEMLKDKFTTAGLEHKQAEQDADTLLCQTAQSLASEEEVVVLVGEDIDLLVILVGTDTPSNVYFLKPGRGKVVPFVYHPQTTIKTSLAQHILFIHAISGCDTTSALFHQGKLKAVKTIDKNPDLLPYIRRFRDPAASPQDITEAGEKFLVVLYGGNHQTTTLNKLRFHSYVTAAYKVSGNIASLPPTEAAASQHSFRTFHQVQQWLGRSLSPEEWGWRKAGNSLIPISTLRSPAPDTLLSLVACSCKKGCTGNCGCRRVGLFCSNLCRNCEGNCTNASPTVLGDDDLLAEEEELFRLEGKCYKYLYFTVIANITIHE